MKHEKEIVIRCDAGGDFGIGHLMRCRTLAQSIEKRVRSRPSFLLHSPTPLPLELLEGIAWSPAPTRVGTRADMEFVCNQLKFRRDTHLVVIDSKLADTDYVNEIRKYAAVCCIQDEDPPKVPADIILNNHVDSEKWYGNPSDGQVRLLGPRFNLIHPAYFDSARENGRNKILVSFGGSDPQNHSLWVVNHLRELFSHHPVSLVLGPDHPDPCMVMKAAKLNANIEVSIAPTTLIFFARQAFLGICAGGTTCYELLAAGLVLAAIAVEPHQRFLIDALARHHAVLDLGGPGPLNPSDSMIKIQNLLDSDRKMREQRDAGTQLFSHSGLSDVVNELTREIPPRWKPNR